MPVYYYTGVELPEEGSHVVKDGSRVARISYMKAIGDSRPGWLVGYGRFEGHRFVMEGEFTARELVIRKASYGLIAYQTSPQGETIDRGWIMVPYTRIDFDGELCIIT